MVDNAKFRDLCKACEVKVVLTGGILYFVDGMDHAIMGVGVRAGRPCVVYDRAKVMDTLMENGDMTYCEAEEVMANKIEGVSVGKSTPIFIVPCEARHIHMATECRIPDGE
jgi:hypothetical protein